MKGFRAKSPGERERDYRPDARSAAWGRYHRLSRRRAFLGCVACPPERRDPNAPTESHHPIEQQRIKRYCRDERLPKTRELALLTDPRNAMLLCLSCHHGQTSAMNPLPRAALSEANWAFAREIGLEDELMEAYR